jgi:hypothetical protein
MHTIYSAHPILLYFNILKIIGEDMHYEAPHYTAYCQIQVCKNIVNYCALW